MNILPNYEIRKYHSNHQCEAVRRHIGKVGDHLPGYTAYSRINSTKPPASGADNVTKPRLMSQVRRVRVDHCVSAVTAVEVPVLVCLRSICSHVTFGGRTLRFVWDSRRRLYTQNNLDSVGVTVTTQNISQLNITIAPCESQVLYRLQPGSTQDGRWSVPSFCQQPPSVNMNCNVKYLYNTTA